MWNKFSPENATKPPPPSKGCLLVFQLGTKTVKNQQFIPVK